jgi:hypothetical protein
MAKKTVASLQDGEKNKSYAKVIRAVKSKKSGSYTFKEEMVPADKVQEYLKQ